MTTFNIRRDKKEKKQVLHKLFTPSPFITRVLTLITTNWATTTATSNHGDQLTTTVVGFSFLLL